MPVKLLAQKNSSVKASFSLVRNGKIKKKMLKKIVYSKEAGTEVVPHWCFFFDYDELGRHAAAKLPCALLHYVIDASCCTTSIEISCCVRLRVEICVVHAENREMGCLIYNATRTLILVWKAWRGNFFLPWSSFSDDDYISGDAFCAAASVITSDVNFSRKEKIVLFAVSTERGKRLAGFLLLPVSFFQY
ncbi:hypothetical protein T05_14261 [Trichinella murrelli]|uniref:Uncharacterized protein n=1 Tax=Trichinella murrelli TaxID=144512 RepID=A0A0V0UBL5_9BILA|nr:hypothetical protein T05_14261 [Trichinella murrelli]